MMFILFVFFLNPHLYIFNVIDMSLDVLTHLYFSQISTVSTSPRLSIEKEFPYFLRLVGPDSSINPGLVELMTYFKWEHLAIITQEEDIFTFVRKISRKSEQGACCGP